MKTVIDSMLFTFTLLCASVLLFKSSGVIVFDDLSILGEKIFHTQEPNLITETPLKEGEPNLHIMTEDQTKLRQEFLDMDKKGHVPSREDIEKAYSHKELVVELQKALYKVAAFKRDRERLKDKIKSYE